MHIHCIQHVSHESPGSILNWIEQKRYSLSFTRTFNKDPYPSTSDFDFLIVLGGPMGTGDEEEYPWLKQEKKLIKQAINEKKKVLGICLGAQLIAEVLGAPVYKNKESEIGWHPVTLTPLGKQSKLFSGFHDPQYVFQWHSDTFELPDKAELLANSEACLRQAFRYKNHVLALQFHLEFTPTIIKELITVSSDELKNGMYIQNADEMLSAHNYFSQSNLLMAKLLNAFE